MTGEGFIWTQAGGRVNLNDYATSVGVNTQGVTMSLPLAISEDGKKIAGIGMNSASQTVAFYLQLPDEILATNEIVKNKINASVYPNPVKDILYIKGAGKIEKAEVYNMVGQKVISLNSVQDKVDVASLSKGNYVLQIFVKGEVSQSYKFIKE
ncbi:T9SS type A sorting domain-containing protein [Chryseobacterium limigenitum]|uniref:Por secretion system C-terminal sorting domain-containing protein n=1 Tax=Chryseobacterium limigenitum TaxID=1612149 RepID=A0A1K2IJ74_9FLAO|nr:T9SS type A sorting domain-containing protein [Chryseobacterium limigenitum]SFZ92489.1 Por secretion system C-terminal sorting domain-containing protein [Chryseobacterium limigenitum]